MTAPAIAPYGEWISPLSAASVVEGEHQPAEAAYVHGEIWWSEPIAAERRVALYRQTPDGASEMILPPPWNVRSRVHEYGGGAWAAGPAGTAFVQFDDQRLYRFDGPATEPMPLTREGAPFRFGGLRIVGEHVLALRETVTGERPGDLERDLVLVPLDGSAAEHDQAVISVVAGSRFLAQPAVSPDGTRIAWIAWDHPNMPWDGTELRVAALRNGRAEQVRTLLGGPAESVLQPEWLDDGTLAVLSDRSGWWNLYRLPADGGEVSPLHPVDRETGGPLWVLGTRWYLPADGVIALSSTLGEDEQGLLNPASGAYRVLRSGRSFTAWQALSGGHALLIDQAATEPGALHELDLGTGAFRVVRAAVDGLPLDHFPQAELAEFDGVHAIVYRPRNPHFTAPEGDLPPFVARVHGGPTAAAGAALDPDVAYYTSRGIGVVDVDHGGSTGYGRAYRERLDGQWGVVDVADVLTVMRGLATAGIADPDRLGIEGGSAGGWTVLSALTSSDLFAGGVSRYGVADAVALALDTHDFEAHYLDRLIGPYPEAAARYAERAPLNRVDRLRTPVLLLQGADDHVVPPAQSQAFRDALAARGIPHAYLEFPGEGHGFRGRDARITVREASLSFYGQVMGFTPPEIPVLPLE